MERVIDRRAYRRTGEVRNETNEEQIDLIQSKIRKFLYQSLAASLLLLGMTLLNFFNCSAVISEINYALKKEITISSLQNSGQIIFDKGVKYYAELTDIVNKIMKENTVPNKLYVNSQNGVNIIDSGEHIFSSDDVLTFASDDIVSGNIFSENNSFDNYESAVEGINQMSEDAKYIKENYEMTVPVTGTITSVFGVRNSSNPKVSAYHCGLDIAANTGTQVLSALDGEVIEAATDTYYGKYIKIKKDDIVMIYAHCSKLLVKVGDKVKKGNLIAYVGNTGNSTGPHLHFELKYNERLVNPLDVLELKK